MHLIFQVHQTLPSGACQTATVPSPLSRLFPAQINTLSGELDSNLEPDWSVQISHVF